MTNDIQTDERLDGILAEYFQQLDQGEAVSPASLLTAHPDLESQLREFFDAASFVEQLAGPTQSEQTQMLSMHDTARSVLLGETIVSGVQPGPARLSPKDGKFPQHFGRYEIVRLLGQGAMGAVYLAYDPSLQRQIALKIPKFADEKSPDMSERFLREARSAAQLRHANICPVYDVGRIDGVHYITMAYIEGRSLAEELRSGRTFQPGEIAQIVRKLALALGKAHAAGVVHRDLKPGNIMLDPDGDPILMDFGLAYREETDELRLTKSGMIVGSPAYMSPEQIDGDPAKIGPASDIYSLGVVLYEMITGKLPFQGTMMSVIGQIARKEPTPVGHWRPELADSPLELLCRKMLAKQPHERPASMQDVAAALDYVLSGLGHEGERGRGGEGETGQSQVALASPPPPLAPSSTLFTPPTPSVKFPEVVFAQERRQRARMFLAPTLILLVLLGLFGALGVVVYVATDNGTLVIESDDPNVEIMIAQPQSDTDKYLEVRLVDRVTGSQVVRLPSGHYRLLLQGQGNEFTLTKDQFVLRRGDKVVAKVVRRPTVMAANWSSFTEVRRFDGHTGYIDAIAFTGDGRRMLTAASDGAAKLWNVGTRRQVGRLDAGFPLHAVAISPDGSLAATGTGVQARIAVWSLAEQKKIKEWQAHQGSVKTPGLNRVLALEFSQDGSRLLSGGDDGYLREWTVATGEQLRQWKGPGANVVTAGYRDDESVFAGQYGRHVTVWNPPDATPKTTISDAKELADASPGGNLIVAGAFLFDANSGARLRPLAGVQDHQVSSVQFTPDGRHIVGGLTDNTIRVWEAATGVEVARIATSHEATIKVVIAPDGRHVASYRNEQGNDNAVVFWELPGSVWPQSDQARAGRTFAEVGRLVGHKDNIDALAYSPDGKFLFSGGGERLLYQWDVAAARVIRKIPVGDFPQAIAVHPDGRHVISSQYGGSITLWSLESGRAVRQFSGHTSAVQSLAISPDGKRLLSGGRDGLVRLWDVETGEPIRSFQENYCDAVALSSDGRLAAHGATGSGLCIWDTETGEKLHQISRATAAVRAAAFSSDGTVVATGDGYGLIQVWDVKTGKQVHHFDAHASDVTSLVFVPGGRFFVSGSYDKTMRLFDLAQGKEIAQVNSATLCVSHLAIAPDGRTLASGGGKRPRQVDGVWRPVKDGDYDIRLWRLPATVVQPLSPVRLYSIAPAGDPRAITEVLKIDGHTEHVSGLAVTRDGQTIVSASADGTVLARDLQPRRTRLAFSGHRRERQVAVDASSDGTLIVSGDFDGKLRLNRSGAGSVKEIDAHEGGVLMVRLSQDATKVLTTGCDNNAKLWNTESGELIQTFQGHTDWVPDGAFGAFDWQVATTSADRTIRLWSAATGAEIAQLDTGGEIAVTLCVSPDLQTIAAGMRDGSVRLFGAKERNELRRLVGHTYRVRDLVFTPDSKHLISGSYDRTMRVWSVETGAEVARIEHARHIFNALAMSPDGRHVFSAGGIWKPDEEKNEWTPENDYAIRMWRLPESVWPQPAAALPDKPAVAPTAVTEITTAERLFTGPKSHGFSIAVSKNGGQALVGHYGSGVSLWDVASGKQIRQFPGTEKAVHRVLFWPDGKHVLAASEDASIRLWNLETGAQVRQFQGHTGRVDSLALSRDGSLLLSASADYGQDRDNTVRLWDAATGQELRRFGQPVTYIRDVVFSRDARKAYGAGAGLTAIVEWDVSSGQPVHRFRDMPTPHLCLAVSPDGGLLATGHAARLPKEGIWDDRENCLLRLWDLESRSVVREFHGHSGPVGAVAFTPDGRLLLSAATSEHDAVGRLVPSREQTVRVWNVSTGQELARYQMQERVIQLAVLPNGKSFLTVGDSIRLWRLPESVWPSEAAAVLPAAAAQVESTTAAALQASWAWRLGVPVEYNHSLGVQFRFVPPGEFPMGSSDEGLSQLQPQADWFFARWTAERRKDEQPQHQVRITRPFYLAAREVTVGQFRAFVEATSYRAAAQRSDSGGPGYVAGDWQLGKQFGWQNPGFVQTDEHPVCNLAWDDAAAYCQWLAEQGGTACRLPTEAEWEYACRAGTTTLFSSGDDVASLAGAANLADQSLAAAAPSVKWAADWNDEHPHTAPVGKLRPNAFGLYDMHGNASEWCADWLGPYVAGPAEDPTGPASGEHHVFRGGAFDNWTGFARSADRYSSHSPTLRTDWAGLRVALSVEDVQKLRRQNEETQP